MKRAASDAYRVHLWRADPTGLAPTTAFGPHCRRGSATRRGSAIAASLVMFTAVAGLMLAAAQVSSTDLRLSRNELDKVRARALSDSGVEIAKAVLAEAAGKTNVHDPLDGIRAMFANAGNAVGPVDTPTATPWVGEPVLANGRSIGEHSTSLALVVDAGDRVVVEVTSTGYYPAAPQNLGPLERLSAWDSVTVQMEFSVAASSVFDNAYFVNNWGWLYGNTININGNARSNGQMDIGGYRPKITGQPLYDGIEWNGSQPTLGAQTSEGGLYSAWDVVNASRAQGTGGGVDIHDFEEAISMPNLTDLSRYEEIALNEGASISIGGVLVANGVVGDEPGEAQNLFLVGTRSDPIELNGSVVVRGDVIITGYVTGQGAIYSGGNAYVPDSIEYVNGPTSSRPAQNSPTATEQWLSGSQDKDFLGLFARENIVVGDFQHSAWQHYVGYWLGSALNASAEDSGIDLIPNTLAGRDGVLGTADDDFLEGDGVFSAEYYTAADDLLGLIPHGFSVGDPVPGTGEDIDGDGQYDATIEVADFEFDSPIAPGLWEGNLPGTGVVDYSSMASLYANHLDGVFYTNHAFSWVVFGRQPAELNGAMIARNENIVYGTSKIDFNYDARLMGGGAGLLLDDMLPLTMRPLRTVQWRRNPEDPHRALAMP